MTRSNGPRNLLLHELPADDTERLIGRMQLVRLRRLQSVFEPGGTIRQAYFPLTGALSELATLEDGSAVEVGLIGWEGLAGSAVVLGSAASQTWVVCQTSGLFLRLPAQALVEEANRDLELHRRLHRYIGVALDQRAVTAACESRHDVATRCARHILAVHDLGFGDELTQTHDFLALRLGVQRPTVTGALGELQRLGAITSRRGHVTVVDRTRLERLACDCYRLARRDLARQYDWVPATALPGGHVGTTDAMSAAS